METGRFLTVKGDVSCTYIKLFTDYLDAIEPLGDAERGRLFSALLLYARTGECAELSGDERFLFPMMRSQIDRDRAAYDEIVEKRRAAGREGGRGNKKTRTSEVVGDEKNKIQNTREVEGVSESPTQNIGEVEAHENPRKKRHTKKKANAFSESICKQDKDKEKDKDEDEEKDKDELCTTTTTVRARMHSANGCEEDLAFGGASPAPEAKERATDGRAQSLRRLPKAYAPQISTSLQRLPQTSPPGFLEVADYFRCECCLDEAVREAEKFIAYNAMRRWDCLPEWQLAADLWAARAEREPDPLLAGVELWRRSKSEGGG